MIPQWLFNYYYVDIIMIVTFSEVIFFITVDNKIHGYYVSEFKINITYPRPYSINQ